MISEAAQTCVQGSVQQQVSLTVERWIEKRKERQEQKYAGQRGGVRTKCELSRRVELRTNAYMSETVEEGLDYDFAESNEN